MHKPESWLEEALLGELGPVEAPAALWGRVQSAGARSKTGVPRGRSMAWALACAGVIACAVLGMYVHVRAAPGVEVRPGQVSARQAGAGGWKPASGFRQEDARGACLLCHA
jgi:hypothetical protein